MLNITSCTVTNNNGLLLKYSILSIVGHIDEIFIFDDSGNHEYNYVLKDLSKYKNVKVFRTDIFGKNLGKKKQFLVDNARNDIVMRWDDDFVLYDVDLLYSAYKTLQIPRFKGIVAQNYNLAFAYYYLREDKPYSNNEIYIYKKDLITFGKKKNFIDFPIKNDANAKLKYYDKPIFLHFWNFKACDKLFYRDGMTPFLFDTKSENYLEWSFNRLEENYDTNYDFNTLISFHRKTMTEFQEYKYDVSKLKKIGNWNDYKKLLAFKLENKELFNYIEQNYQIKYVENNQFLYILNETNRICNIHTNQCKITNAISKYIFKKLSGIVEIKEVKSPFNMDYHYQISHSLHNTLKNCIIWGSGVLDEYIDFRKKSEIYCVRGPLTIAYLKSKNIIIDKYGEPILLISLLYNEHMNKKYSIGIACNKEINNETSSDVKLIEYECNCENEYDVKNIINSINECHQIVTDNYVILVLCHSYNIPVLYINIDDKISQILDYAKGIYSFDYQICLNIDINEVINNIDNYMLLYEKPDMLIDRKQDLIMSCPFVEETLKPLLLKMI